MARSKRQFKELQLDPSLFVTESQHVHNDRPDPALSQANVCLDPTKPPSVPQTIVAGSSVSQRTHSSSISTAATTIASASKPVATPSEVIVATPETDTSSTSAVITPTIVCADMRLSVSHVGRMTSLKFVIKRHLFKKMKFIDKDMHMDFSLDPTTVCGLIMGGTHINTMSIPEAQRWWKENKQLVHQTHTIHRNNCIKIVQKKFKGN